MKHSIILTLILLLCFCNSNAQNKTTDSLLNALKRAKTDTEKAKLYFNLSKQYEPINADSALLFCNKSILFLKYLDDIHSIDKENASEWQLKANAIQYLGLLSRKHKGLYDDALALYQEALKIDIEISKCTKDSMFLQSSCASGYCYNSMANVMQYQGDFPKALVYYQKSLKIFEDLPELCKDPTAIEKSKLGICFCYSNIGNIHLSLNNFSVAKEYFLKSLKLDQEMNKKDGIGYDYQNLGNVCFYEKKYSEALKYYNNAIEINKELNNQSSVGFNYLNIGNVFGEHLLLLLSLNKSNWRVQCVICFMWISFRINGTGFLDS
jgi:tetratricopeptide (TPR) repeat protein